MTSHRVNVVNVAQLSATPSSSSSSTPSRRSSTTASASVSSVSVTPSSSASPSPSPQRGPRVSRLSLVSVPVPSLAPVQQQVSSAPGSSDKEPARLITMGAASSKPSGVAPHASAADAIVSAGGGGGVAGATRSAVSPAVKPRSTAAKDMVAQEDRFVSLSLNDDDDGNNHGSGGHTTSVSPSPPPPHSPTRRHASLNAVTSSSKPLKSSKNPPPALARAMSSSNDTGTHQPPPSQMGTPTLASWLFRSRSAPTSPSFAGSESPTSTISSIGSPQLTPSTTQAHLSRTRPPTLPPKPASEDAKHLREYEAMLARAERKATKHAQRAAKRAAKREAAAAANLAYWTKHVLPPDVWDKVRYSDKLAQIWVAQGVPPRLRGVVWPRAVGNALHVTGEVFRVCCARATEALTSRRLRDEAEADGNAPEPTPPAAGAPDMVLVGREDTLSIIHTDISRTFPHLGLFQSPHGPLAASLATVLEAFAVYRADMGYVQGMSYLAGVLLVNMDEQAAFVTLGNMFRHRQGVLNVMYRLDMPRVKAYFAVFEYLLHLACPELKVHLDEIGVRPEFYLYEWLLSMFSKPLPLDTAHRVWDLFFLWGDLALFRVAVALLKFFEPRLLGLPFEECIQDVLRLPGRIRHEYDEDEFWKVVEFLHLERDVYRAACRKEGIEPPE